MGEPQMPGASWEIPWAQGSRRAGLWTAQKYATQTWADRHPPAAVGNPARLWPFEMVSLEEPGNHSHIQSGEMLWFCLFWARKEMEWRRSWGQEKGMWGLPWDRPWTNGFEFTTFAFKSIKCVFSCEGKEKRKKPKVLALDCWRSWLGLGNGKVFKDWELSLKTLQRPEGSGRFPEPRQRCVHSSFSAQSTKGSGVQFSLDEYFNTVNEHCHSLLLNPKQTSSLNVKTTCFCFMWMPLQVTWAKQNWDKKNYFQKSLFLRICPIFFFGVYCMHYVSGKETSNSPLYHT